MGYGEINPKNNFILPIFPRVGQTKRIFVLPDVLGPEGQAGSLASPMFLGRTKRIPVLAGG